MKQDMKKYISFASVAVIVGLMASTSSFAFAAEPATTPDAAVEKAEGAAKNDAQTGEPKANAEGVVAADKKEAAPEEHHASGGHEEIEIPKQKWPHKGMTGTYDRAALQHGFQIYKEVCSACHSMKFLSYRDLAGLGYNADEIKSIAAEYTVTDGPNDDGEMFERPARPADRFKSPFANDKAARAANGGALPPDLSLIVKARPHGEDYVYALLHGYEEPPAGVTLNPGMHYNKYFAGHQISMAQPLTDGQVTYGDGTAASLDQAAHDVVSFLAWAGEPHMEARKQIGIKICLYVLAFAAVMFGVKKKVWKD